MNMLLSSVAKRDRRITRSQVLLGGGLVLVVLAILRRYVDGGDDLTAEGTSSAMLRVAAPILLAGLGGLWAERAGVVNIGLEGMMILGTWMGAWGGYRFGIWQGVALGIVAGCIGGLIHALATVTFRVDHIISGVAINILAAGTTRFGGETVFVNAVGGGETQSPRVVGQLPKFTMPFFAGGDLFGWQSPDIAGRIASWRWFFVSDIFDLMRGFTAEVSALTILTVLLVPLSGWVLWKTAFGLRLRACGENPHAAETLGVDAYRLKFLAVMISGGFAGLGGAYLVIGSGGGIYKEGQTAGRGFLGLAAMVFGNWRPGGLAAGSGLFGFASALEYRSDDAVHALILFVGILLCGAAIYFASLRRWRASLAGLVIAALLLWWRSRVPAADIPNEVDTALPYLTVLIVLAVFRTRSKAPAMVGIPYRRGEAT